MKLLSGVKNIFGSEYVKKARIIDLFNHNMDKYLYNPIETPIIDNKALYMGTAGETSDMISKELYFATNRHSSSMDVVLRPEGTASVVRAAVNIGRWQEQNLKFYYHGPMFRHNRPQKWRLRQFDQLGCEVINPHSLIMAENIICLVKFLDELQINFTLDLNILPGCINEYSDKLRTFFTKHIDRLNDTNLTTLSKNPIRLLDQLSQDPNFNDAPKPVEFASEKEKAIFSRILNILDRNKIKYNLNSKLVRGLDYYLGPVFECLVDDVAIAGGGGYSMQGSRFGLKKNINGIGWSIGLEPIMHLAKINHIAKSTCLVCSLGEDDYAFEVADILRNNSFRANVFLDGIKKASQYISKIEGTVFIICVGEIEKNNRKVNLKRWNTDKNAKLVDLESIFDHIR